MMSCIEDIIVNNNRSAWLSLEQSIETPKNEKTIMWVSEENCRVIQNSITMPFLEKFDQAVNTLDKARRIFLVGIRSARAATVFFRSMLSQLLPDISILEYGIDEAFETILDMSANDVVVVITLRSGPNCFAVTPLNILRFASRRGLKTILVTNDLSCPGVSYADLSICVGQADGHYTLTPVLTLLEAIVIDLGRLKKDIARKKLKDLENVFEEQNIVLPNSELS